MFSKWLNTDKLASWDKVIEALTLIGLDNVASNIGGMLKQGELHTVYIGVQNCTPVHVCMCNYYLQ